MKKECIAMLLAGGQGSRLYVLTSDVAKPAVPFGGKYRIIDFPLSNCTNSGIDTVGVLTQYKPLELNSYIGSGQPWDLDRLDGGVHILPPYMQEGEKGSWFKGTANAIYQNIGFVDMYDPDYVVIGEASECNLKIGQRGRAELVVETFGVPANSANPEKGVNAVYGMCRAVEALRQLEVPEHPVLGRGILELTDIRSDPYPGASVVPFYCRATYDRRLLVGETPESVLSPVRAALEGIPGLRAGVSFAQGEAPCCTGETIRGERFFPGWLYGEEEPFVQAVLEELRRIGQDPEVTQYSFCTNGSHYAGEAGIRTIGYGPSLESLAHTDDEYVEIAQLEKACEGYYAVMKALLREKM